MSRFDRADAIPLLFGMIIAGFLLYACFKLIVDEPIFGSIEVIDEGYRIK